MIGEEMVTDRSWIQCLLRLRKQALVSYMTLFCSFGLRLYQRDAQETFGHFSKIQSLVLPPLWRLHGWKSKPKYKVIKIISPYNIDHDQ